MQWNWIQHCYLMEFLSSVRPCESYGFPCEMSLWRCSVESQYREWNSKKKQLRCQWFETPSRSLYRHCNVWSFNSTVIQINGCQLLLLKHFWDCSNEEVDMSYAETMFVQCHKHLDLESSIMQIIVLHTATAVTGGFGWRWIWMDT